MNAMIDADGIWLPIDSLSRGSRGLWTVFVAVEVVDQSATVERREVEIVHTDGDRALVRGTVFGGDRVIIAGTHRVVPGQRIQLQSGDASTVSNDRFAGAVQ